MKNKDLSLLLCWLVVTLALPESLQARDARTVLTESGVQGGLVVHLGCGTGMLTGNLLAGDGFLIHGLDPDAVTIHQAREHLRSRKLYGRVSVEQFDGAVLPYVDNIVRLLVVENAGHVGTQEMMRVLTPEGVLMVKHGDEWQKSVKPWPDTIDEWTHVGYNPAGNMVSTDQKVDSPFHAQWMAGPTWNRQHKTSAFVSARGRVFFIHSTQHGAVKPWNMGLAMSSSEEWSLLARDAFSGVLLWQRPLKSWGGGGSKKIGPSDIGRRLVAKGDYVYVTLGHDQPLSILEAATGRTVVDVRNSKGTEEILVQDGLAFLLCNPNPPIEPLSLKVKVARENRSNRRIMAINVETGETAWEASDLTVLNASMIASTKRLFYHAIDEVVCLDRATGEVSWRTLLEGANKRPPGKGFFGSQAYAPKMVAHKGRLLCSFNGIISALDAASGKKLWQNSAPASNYVTAPDLVVKDGVIWLPGLLNRGTQECVKLDLVTGQPLDYTPNRMSLRIAHHRCSPVHATEKYLVFSSSGIELQAFNDPSNLKEHIWARSSCYSGITPANGMLYISPHNCACFFQGKLTGYVTMAPRSEDFALQLEPRAASDIPFEKGPAYDRISPDASPANPPSSIINHQSDWPTYRGNSLRSGETMTKLPAQVKKAWTATIGGRLTQPVISDGMVLLAAIDAHTVYALNAEDGTKKWHYMANGRVDSPPTIHNGHVIFGCADGWVYCLRATDGALAWRLRAAPGERRIVSRDGLESAWPVHGSVLVWDDVVYCLAGRSSNLDGGMRLLRIDYRTGKVLMDKCLYTRKAAEDPSTCWQDSREQNAATLRDILSSDGEYLYLQSAVFDKQCKPLNSKQEGGARLIAAAGYLDDSWWKRIPWMYGKRFPTYGKQGAVVVRRAYHSHPAGVILAHDKEKVYGWGGNWPNVNRPELGIELDLDCRIFAADMVPLAEDAAKEAAKERRLELKDILARGNETHPERNLGYLVVSSPRSLPVDFEWSQRLDGQVWALCLAGDTLAFAGAQGEVSNVTTERLVSSKPPALWLADKQTGKTRCKVELHSAPVWDGMAAANGKLFISHRDGSISCYGGN